MSSLVTKLSDADILALIERIDATRFGLLGGNDSGGVEVSSPQSSLSEDKKRRSNLRETAVETFTTKAGYVTTSRSAFFNDYVQDMTGYNIEFDPKLVEIVLTAASNLNSEDKRVMRMYAILGDAALTKILALRKIRDERLTPEQFQLARAALTSNKHLCLCFSKSVWLKLGQFSPMGGANTAAGADMFEAVIGLLSQHLSDASLENLLVLWEVFA